MQAIRVGAAQPVRDVQRLTRLLCDRIETIDPGFGIEIMVLTAVLVEPLGDRRAPSLIEEQKPDVSDLIDINASRVGEHRLCRFVPVRAMFPNARWRVPPLTPETGATWEGDGLGRAAAGAAGTDRDHGAAARPSPAWFTWRGMSRAACGAPTGRSAFAANGGNDAEMTRSGITSASRTKRRTLPGCSLG